MSFFSCLLVKNISRRNIVVMNIVQVFSGLGIFLCDFSFSNLHVTTTGRVTYQSRYLRSNSYRRNLAANRIVVSEFGTAAYPDPCKTLFQR